MGRFPAQRRRATAMIWVIISMIALMMFISLAVDLGRVQLAKTELQRAADAAARYGATGLSNGTYVSKAQAAASDNTCDGTTVSLQSGDVVAVTWANGTFTVGGSSPNGIKVTACRTSARSNAIPLMFAKVLGMDACNVTATSIAKVAPPVGFIGLDSIAIHASNFIASYDSSVTTAPSTSSYTSNGVLESNGTIGIGMAGGGNQLYGSTSIGPSGSVGALLNVSGSSKTLTSAIPTPPAPTMSAASNPGGVSATPTLGGGTYSWPGGTYYFTSFTMNNSATLSFTGAATIMMDGSASFHDHNAIFAYGSKPANLVWNQSAAGSFNAAHDDCTFVMVLNAPQSDFSMHDRDTFQGSIIAKTITIHDSSNLFFDTSLGQSSTAGGAISLVK